MLHVIDTSAFGTSQCARRILVADGTDEVSLSYVDPNTAISPGPEHKSAKASVRVSSLLLDVWV